MAERYELTAQGVAPARAPTVLVPGGAGFVGRHAVLALLGQGCRVIVGSRQPSRIDPRLPAEARACERRALRFEELLTPDAWDEALAGIDVVLNCVGILRQRGRETYERIHHLAPAALAAACREHGLRLIHVSALGLDGEVRSGFLRSKRAGEAAIRASGADWHIVRPSLLDGDGGYGAAWLRRVARWPVHPLPADASGRIAVLDVRDLGAALARLVSWPATASRGSDDCAAREFDLGGPTACTLAAHLARLRRATTARPAWRLPVPGLLARAGSHLCDLLRLTPYSFGHWELLRRDNCPAHNRLPELLGRAPRRQLGTGATDCDPCLRPRRPLALSSAMESAHSPRI